MSVLHISTHILYTSYETEAFYLLYTTAGFMNIAKNVISVCTTLMALCPISFNCDRHMVQRICNNIHTKADGIKVATPVYELTVSPPAASKQHPRQDQVINGTRYLQM